MAAFKCTYIFDDGGAGWSESIYLISGVDDPDARKPSALAYALFRARGLASGDPPNGIVTPTIKGVRVANVNNPNQSGLFPSNAAIQQAGKDNGAEMMGTRTAVITLYSAGKAHRRKYGLRGLPLDWLSGDLNDRRVALTDPDFKAWFNQFKAFVLAPAQGGNWALRVKPYVAPPPGAPFNGIPAVQVDPTTGRWQIKAPGVNPVLGLTQKVAIRGFRGKGLSRINGPTQIVGYDITTGWYTLNKRPCTTCRIQVKVPGVILIPGATTYEPITAVEFSGFGQHATGRAFFPPPTRRSRTRCCR